MMPVASLRQHAAPAHLAGAIDSARDARNEEPAQNKPSATALRSTWSRVRKAFTRRRFLPH